MPCLACAGAWATLRTEAWEGPDARLTRVQVVNHHQVQVRADQGCRLQFHADTYRCQQSLQEGASP